MKRSLTIQLQDESNTTLEQIGRRQHRPAEAVATDIIERTLTVARLREIRDQLTTQAQAAGFRSEDDILEAIS